MPYYFFPALILAILFCFLSPPRLLAYIGTVVIFIVLPILIMVICNLAYAKVEQKNYLAYREAIAEYNRRHNCLIPDDELKKLKNKYYPPYKWWEKALYGLMYILCIPLRWVFKD